MRTTPEQEQEIANRLGITEPKQPQEVADYLEAWDNYEEAISNFHAERLSTWSKTSEQIKANSEAIGKNISQLTNIHTLGEAIEAFSETTKLASKAWSQAQTEFEKAIQAEADRPEREFERARNSFIQSCEKEQRSLKYRMSRSKHSWNVESPELTAYQENSARYDLLGYLISEARYISRTAEQQEFSEEAIFAKVLENQYRVDDVIAKLATIAENK